MEELIYEMSANGWSDPFIATITTVKRERKPTKLCPILSECAFLMTTFNKFA